MRIYLRDVMLDDGSLIVKWRNNPAILSHCMNQKPITLESNEEFFHKNIETGNYIQYIVERIDEDSGVASYPIATVYLKDIDRINRRCQLCVFTSDDQEWNSLSQSIAIKMLLKKAFEEIGMHKVYSYVFYGNLDESELLRRSGFSTEAILKDEVLNLEGCYDDIVRFAITENEWKNISNCDLYSN